ncbi:hypothetical protein [Vreelandella neptunia]|uniref:DNA-binding protein n=1 Tax=Vreelandella neptunia TaxID=115551 RepID=A0ABZ0YS38_9GAMM|nr:hypothetical protein [Halomonas neptunia]MDN3561666.1 hypothetical protein [Halomonas neptunia]WQH14568.1 hypothetical protein SR894_08525 [Halomonas neptunia]
MGNAQKIDQWLDPEYIQISRQEAARILGRSPKEFDRMRKDDADCPSGFKQGSERSARVLFRLADIYRYSQTLMERNESGNEEA